MMLRDKMRFNALSKYLDKNKNFLRRRKLEPSNSVESFFKTDESSNPPAPSDLTKSTEINNSNDTQDKSDLATQRDFNSDNLNKITRTRHGSENKHHRGTNELKIKKIDPSLGSRRMSLLNMGFPSGRLITQFNDKKTKKPQKLSEIEGKTRKLDDIFKEKLTIQLPIEQLNTSKILTSIAYEQNLDSIDKIAKVNDERMNDILVLDEKVNGIVSKSKSLKQVADVALQKQKLLDDVISKVDNERTSTFSQLLEFVIAMFSMLQIIFRILLEKRKNENRKKRR